PALLFIIFSYSTINYSKRPMIRIVHQLGCIRRQERKERSRAHKISLVTGCFAAVAASTDERDSACSVAFVAAALITTTSCFAAEQSQKNNISLYSVSLCPWWWFAAQSTQHTYRLFDGVHVIHHHDLAFSGSFRLSWEHAFWVSFLFTSMRGI